MADLTAECKNSAFRLLLQTTLMDSHSSIQKLLLVFDTDVTMMKQNNEE